MCQSSLVTDIDANNQDDLLNFEHPPCSSASFKWPSREDTCWVPITNITPKIATPSLSTTSEHYLLNAKD